MPQLEPWQSRPASPSHQRFGKNSTIVLVGANGAGKSTVARIAAHTLDWQVTHLDERFVESERISPAEYCAEYGQEAYTTRRTELLEDVLTRRRHERIVVCTEEDVRREPTRELLREFGSKLGPVIHVLRDRSGDGEDAPDPDPAFTDLCRTICSYEFVSLPSPGPPFKSIERDFTRLLRFVLGVDTNHIHVAPTAPQSYFLAITFDDVRKAIPHLDELSIGIDCWEIRVDLLRSWEPTFLARQVAAMRAVSDLPILVTVRTHSQGGRFPDPRKDTSAAAQYAALVELAIKLGSEYVDVELFAPHETIQHAMRIKGNTKIILSWHDWTGKVSWLGNEVRQIYEVACNEGADVVKMIGWARSFQDNLNLRQFAQAVGQRGKIPLLAVNMGPEGKMSRILNRHLTPVSHPILPSVSAPGQISFFESQQVLFLTGLLPAQDFYLLGSGLSASYSPIIHEAAFRALGLPHHYHLADSARAETYEEVLASPSFGGASVTIPHKIAIIPFLRRLSSHAKAIGAVNTIIATPTGLVGDNTDWRAIRTCISREFSPAYTVGPTTSALVYGAGGAARACVYALWQLGIPNIFVWNRTGQRADDLVSDLARLSTGLNLLRLDANQVQQLADSNDSPQIIVSTLPQIAAEEEPAIPIPTSILSAGGGVLVDLNYKAAEPLLLRATRSLPTWDRWSTVSGLDVLLEQGYEQLRAWTTRRAPRKAMRQAMMDEAARRRGGAAVNGKSE